MAMVNIQYRELQSSRQLRGDQDLALEASVAGMKEHVKSLLVSNMGGDDDMGESKRMMSGYGHPKSM